MPCLADWPAQVVELYTEDGLDRPFFCIIATPESGNVVKIINTGPVEFPLLASVVRPCSRGEFCFRITVRLRFRLVEV